MLNICRRIALLSREVDEMIISGNGSRIDLFRICTDKHLRTINITEGEDIYKLAEGQEGIFVMAERTLHHIPDDELFGTNLENRKRHVLEFDENLLDMYFFEDDQELLIVSRALTTWHKSFKFWEEECQLLHRISPEKIAMFTCSSIMGNSWPSAAVVAGTSLGEITVFKPASREIRTFAGPDGMIFDMCRFESRLFCVADDRSLSVYDCTSLISTDKRDSDDEMSLVKLAQEYGHASRPYAVCTDENGKIYTGGQDAVLFQWEYSRDRGLRITNKQDLNHGVIRSICDIGPSIFVGHDHGSLVRVFLKLMEADPLLSWGNEENVKSFVRLSNGQFDVLTYADEETRFLSRTPLDARLSKYVIHVGEKSIKVRKHNKEILWNHHFDHDVSDALIDEGVAFIFTENSDGFVFGLRNHIIHARLSFKKAFDQLHVTSRLKFTCFSYSLVKAMDGSKRAVVVVGTTTGQLFYGTFIGSDVDVEMTTSQELNSSFKKGPVNHLLCNKANLYALGKNGIFALCALRSNGDIIMMTARPLCPWMKGFNPCGFDENMEVAFGFKGKEFVVVSIRYHHTLASFDCGGPNRQWYFTTHLPSDDLTFKTEYFFDFLSKGKIYTAHLDVKVTSCLALPPNKGRIIAATTIFAHELYSALATVGSDHSVTIFRIFGPRQDRDWNLVLHNEATPTSVCSTVVLSGEYMVIVGGEKGSVTTWLINPVDLIDLDPRQVLSHEWRRGDSSARVTAVSTNRHSSRRRELPDLEHYVATAFADGVIEILKVVFANDKLGLSLEVFRRIDRTPHFSVPTKVWCYRRRSPDIEPISELEIHAVSTSGLRALHITFSWNDPEIQKRMITQFHNVEKCGLSALAIAPISHHTEGREPADMILVGSESGNITLFHSPIESAPKRRPQGIYHSATVTGLLIFSHGGHNYAVSVALDCRLALWRINRRLRLELIKSFVLDVRDPSDVAWVNLGALVVGDGMQYIHLEPYLLPIASRRSSTSSL
ncbi:hypothetical protein Aduo_019456 [Ancylostoma duodenale]